MQRIYPIAFYLGLAALAVLVVLGVVRTQRDEHGMPGLSQNHLRKVEAMLSSGETKTAMAELRMATHFFEDRGVLSRIVKIGRRIDDQDSVIYAYLRLIELGSGNAGMRNSLAMLLLVRAGVSPENAGSAVEGEARADLEKALELTEDVLSERPDLAEACLNQGLAQGGLGHPARARRQFRRALKLDAKLAAARTALRSLRGHERSP